MIEDKTLDAFYDELSEMNGSLESPLEDNEVESTYRSAIDNSYDNYACSQPPCSDYCDKTLCAKQEYSPVKGKGNRFTGASCWGELTKVLSGEPYYIWKIRVKPDEDFREVRIDSVEDLHNQTAVQIRCLRDLNWGPNPVKAAEWMLILNKCLEGVKERQVAVSKETDTTEMGELRGLFLQFLTHKQIRNGQPCMVQVGQVYHADGAYYFTTKGIMDFLRYERFSLGKINLRELLIAYGCVDGEIGYKTIKGEEKIIKCWKKPEDEELLTMSAFYEDVYEADADILQKNKLDKEKQESAGVDDTKF